MTINTTDFKRYLSQVVDDTASNGGRMSANEAVDNVAENVWPHVPQSERTAGSTKYRKLFHKIDNADDLPGNNTRIFLERPTPGDDRILIFAGTQTDTQNDISSPRLYGAGSLNASAISGASTIDVLVEAAADNIFQNGDTIRISDKPDINSAGNEEYHVINGAPTAAGNVITITLTGTLANGYSNADTVVASVIEHGTLAASATAAVVTSASGTFDDNELTVHHEGGVYENITVTFTSATAFDVTGDTLGSLGSGNTGAAFAPVNADFGTPYFTIAAAAWGGTYAASDTVTFTTSPAAAPIWEKRVVPAGANSIASFARVMVMDLEAA